MATIKSVQQEIDDLMQKSQVARDEAQRLQEKATQHMAVGSEDEAARETLNAHARQKEADDFARKAEAKRSELDRLQSEATNIQSRISDLQGQLNQING